MDYEFKSLKELYDRITPALISKKDELRKYGFSNIMESDIWNYLTDIKWKSALELTLSEMVNDIFTVNGEDIINHVIRKVDKEDRKPNLEDTEILDI